MILIGIEKYKEHHNKGHLPIELERFRHKIAWPILLKENYFALGNVHEENYIIPSGCTEWHTGVDLHTSTGTEIFVPEESYLLYAIKDTRPGKQKIDLFMQGQETKVIYTFCHLDFESLPNKIKRVSGPGKYRYLPITRGELLGSVGEWHLPITDYPNHEDSIAKYFDTRNDHLHISTSLVTEKDFEDKKIFSWRDAFNPLLLFTSLK